MVAKGSAEWRGDVQTGTGTFTAGDTISGGYTFKSRFEDGPGSNPEQLIGAAHAACFSMALCSLLTQAGTPPDSVHTDATVTLRPLDGKPTITKIDLVTVGKVPESTKPPSPSTLWPPRPGARSAGRSPAFLRSPWKHLWVDLPHTVTERGATRSVRPTAVWPLRRGPPAAAPSPRWPRWTGGGRSWRCPRWCSTGPGD